VPAFEFSLFETIVWGPRIEMLYLLPFSNLFASQSMADFGDNAFMGMSFRWHCAPGFQFLGQLYVDDLHFNDIARFDFNTKYKVAAELGLVWAPKDGMLRFLAFDYTAITSYTYTHIYSLDPENFDKRYPSQGNGDITPPPNYLDYTHAGKNLGPDMEPNSDRISIRTTWNTLPNLDLGLSAYFSRHGNASENRINDGLMDGKYHKGDIFDDGSNDHSPHDNNYRYLNFLTQSTIETKLAGGITLNWQFPFPFRFGDFSLHAEYVAEYAWNRNLIRDNNNLVHYWAAGGTFKY
jgi:hypothetical protein